MLFHDARSEARLDETGDLVVLDEQDRTRWDADEIAEAAGLLEAALRLRRAGPFQVQAAIAACHAQAPDAADTDWVEIAALYGRLADMVPSAVVELNRAVAVSFATGPEAGLVMVERLSDAGELRKYHHLPAARADMLRRLGRFDEAVAAYQEALDLVNTEAERRFLERRLDEQPV
jgi:RNA polymerase sigma-70 factor (ECF subfamily)